MTAVSNEDLAQLLASMKQDAASSRDAIMAKFGQHEVTLKTLSDGLQSVKAQADRAEKIAIEAKKLSSDSVHDYSATSDAVIKHVDKLQEQIALQSTKEDAESLRVKLDALPKTIAAAAGLISVLVPLILELIKLFHPT